MRIEEAVFKRKSIRKYKMDGLDQTTIDIITRIVNEAAGIDSKIDFKGYFVKDGEKVRKLFDNFVSKYIRVKAPHYIVITSEEKEGYLANVGFAFEEVILKLTSMGIGTCWVGAPFNRKMVKNLIELEDNHIPVIIIALGEPEDFFSMYRKNIQEFKRIGLNEMVTGDIDEGIRNSFEYVRVAPSGINSQPWRFSIEEEYIDVTCVRRKNKISKLIYDKMNLVDIGIGLYHLKVGLEANGCKFNLKDRNINDKKNQKYITSIKYKNR